MKKTVMLWGSMSKAKIVHKLILNQHTELNISSFNTNLKNNNKLTFSHRQNLSNRCWSINYAKCCCSFKC